METRLNNSSRLPDLSQWNGWTLFILALATLALMAPALWNGYPLVYFDSEDYVEISFSWQPIIYRIMTYGAFVSVARPFDTLWMVVVVQSLLQAWLLHEAVCAFVGRMRRYVYVGLVLLLTLLTGLPWVVSQIMADMFAGTAILGVAVLAFGQYLPLYRRLALVPLVMLAVAVHMTHVAVGCGLVLVLLGVRLAAIWVRRMPRPNLILPILAVSLGTLAVPATHYLATGRIFFSESGRVLQLALFVQNGLAKKYLDDVCPLGATYKMCQYKDGLPYTADEFLWGDSPFDDMGGWKAMHDEADAIVGGAIAMFPKDVAVHMLNDTLTQMDLIGSGEDLVPMTWHFVKTQLKRYPRDFRSFRFALQQRREGIDFEPLNEIQVPVAQAAQLAMIGAFFVAWRRRDRISIGFILIVAAALVGNALVCGAMSNPHDRYQARIVWLALMAVIVCAIRLDQRFVRRKGDKAIS